MNERAVDPGDPLVAFPGNSLQVEDDIYQLNDFDYRGSRVLLRLDPSSMDLSKAEYYALDADRSAESFVLQRIIV